MSKNEIRLRRQKLTSRGTERYRNYGAILQRHEQEMRIKKILRAFSMFLIVLIILILIVIVVRMERKANKNGTPTEQTSSLCTEDRQNNISENLPTGLTVVKRPITTSNHQQSASLFQI